MLFSHHSREKLSIVITMKNADEASGWPQFTHDEGELHPDNSKAKKSIADRYGEDSLWKSWITTCNKLNDISQEISSKQTSKIPDISYDEALSLSDDKRELLKAAGCFVVRGTIPTETAEAWFNSVQKYVKDNEGTITGNPPCSRPHIAPCSTIPC